MGSYLFEINNHKDYARKGFKYPTTNYIGSKKKLLNWIWDAVKGIKFNSMLDIFGGTGSVSLMFKRYGKLVFYNDILKFNQITAKAIIENKNTIVNDDDIENVLNFSKKNYPNLVSTVYNGLFFKEEENQWIDKVITNILEISNEYKKAIFLAALFRACLAKVPFGNFSSPKLRYRSKNKKAIYKVPFVELFKKFINEYNKAVFDNGQNNKVVGGFDALEAPNDVDLVYIDPPYFFSGCKNGCNYLTRYNFLEVLANYNECNNINFINTNGIKKIKDTPSILNWIHRKKILNSFDKLINRYQDSIIVLSYQDNTIPNKDEILEILRKYKKKINLHTKPYYYALKQKRGVELLFIAQ